MPERIGLLVGWENTFPPAFIERVNKEPGIVAEIAKIGGTSENSIRRIACSSTASATRSRSTGFYLKAAALAGTLRRSTTRSGGAPTTSSSATRWRRSSASRCRARCCSRRRSYIPADRPRALAPQPRVPARLGGHHRVRRLPRDPQARRRRRLEATSPRSTTSAELLRAYDASGELVDDAAAVHRLRRVRALHLHRQGVHPPHPLRPEAPLLPRERSTSSPRRSSSKVARGSYALNHALGYDMNSVEFAIKDGVPYAIDFTNPAPDFDVHSILPKHFHIVVEADGAPGGQLRQGRAAQPPRLPLRSVHR